MEASDPSRLDRYRDLLPEDEFRQVMNLFHAPSPPAIRLNPLKVDPKKTIQELAQRYGWSVEPVPFCPAGWVLKGMETSPGETIEFRNGHYYIQEASSMLPVEAFQFKDKQSELILDMAAAPGGKTTHLAARSGDVGLLVANDSSRRRLRALTRNLRSWGALSVLVTNFQGERVGQQLRGVFDKVLLDAPCSGDGLRMGGGSKGRLVSEREREALQSQQIGMLQSGLDTLREGGELVYATCTAAPEENEAVIQAALDTRPGEIELVRIHLLEAEQGGQALTAFEENEFDPSLARAVRLWPHQFNTGAFFTARIRKIKATGESVPMSAGVEPPKILGEEEVGKMEAQLAQFGFELRSVCQRMALVLIERDRFVHAVPELWLTRLPGLPVVDAGLPMGRWQGKEFLPAYEWVTRFDAQFTERRVTLDEQQAQIWLQGRDLREGSPTGLSGPILLQDEMERFLGVGNSSARRVRNLLPRTWVAG